MKLSVGFLRLMLSTQDAMQHSYDYITINNPNIQVLSDVNVTYGVFTDTPRDQLNEYEPGVVAIESKDLYLPNFSLRSYHGTFKHDALLTNQSLEGRDLLGSCLFVKGRVKTYEPHATKAIDGFSRSQNFKYDPNNECSHVLLANVPFHVIHLSYTPEYFHDFFPENECWATVLKTKINKQERIVGQQATPITLAQERALQNIMDCPLSGELGLMLMETSMIQIILLQLHALFHDTPSLCKMKRASNQDVDLVQALKEHLSKNYLSDHTLASLAKQFGTNTNKLMSVFKTVFKKSIFEFITELRMEHAGEMLRDRDVLVTEVSRTVGYKNPNHFSAAFKRHYGVRPTEWRESESYLFRFTEH